jgi:hypothetical protein
MAASKRRSALGRMSHLGRLDHSGMKTRYPGLSVLTQFGCFSAGSNLSPPERYRFTQTGALATELHFILRSEL